MKMFSKKDKTEVVAVQSAPADVSAPEQAEEESGKKELSLSSLTGLFGKKKVDPADLTWTSPVRPSAYLMANYIRHRRAMAAAIKKVTRLGVGATVVIALAIAGSFALNFMASTEKEEAEVALADAQDKLKGLAKASKFFDGLENREMSVNNELAAEIDYGRVLTSVAAGLPPGSQITSVQTKYGTLCASPDPFLAAAAIGCVEFTVNVKDLGSAAAFLEKAGDKYVNSFLVTSTSSKDKGSYTLSGTANFTAETFTYRFVEKEDAPEPEQATDPNAPAGDPNATPPADPAAGGAPESTPTNGGN